jgi:hypothetical protein
MAAEAVPISVILARASSFYQWALEYRRAHPETRGIDGLVAESLGLLTLAHEEYVRAGRAL